MFINDKHCTECHKIHLLDIDQCNPLCPLLEIHMSTNSAPFMGCTTKLYTILPKIPGDKSCLSSRLDKNIDTSAEVNLSCGVGFIGIIYVYDSLQTIFYVDFLEWNVWISMKIKRVHLAESNLCRKLPAVKQVTGLYLIIVLVWKQLKYKLQHVIMRLIIN